MTSARPGRTWLTGSRWRTAKRGARVCELKYVRYAALHEIGSSIYCHSILKAGKESGTAASRNPIEAPLTTRLHRTSPRRQRLECEELAQVSCRTMHDSWQTTPTERTLIGVAVAVDCSGIQGPRDQSQPIMTFFPASLSTRGIVRGVHGVPNEVATCP
jgi:hypothetical protein